MIDMLIFCIRSDLMTAPQRLPTKINIGLCSDTDTCSESDKLTPRETTGHLKKRILVQDQGGFEFQTAGIRLYVEDFEPGSNTEMGPKDFFEMACKSLPKRARRANCKVTDDCPPAWTIWALQESLEL